MWIYLDGRAAIGACVSEARVRSVHDHRSIRMEGVLGALSADTAGQLDVLGHDGHTLGVDRAQVGVLEQRSEVCFGRLLQRHDGMGLEAEIGLEVLRDLTNQTLERKLADEELGTLLILADLTKSDSAGPALEQE